MKKKSLLLVILMLALLLTFTLVACGKDNGGGGGSYTEGMFYHYDGNTKDGSDYIELKKDGTWFDGDDSGTYSLNGTAITFYLSGEEFFKGTVENGVLTVDIWGIPYTYKTDSAGGGSTVGNTEETEKAKIKSVTGGTISNMNVDMEVASTVEHIDMSGIVTVSDNSSWQLYYDVLGQTNIPTKYAANLKNGENVYYIVVTSSDATVNRTYTLTIWKNYLATITYKTNGWVYTTEQAMTHTTLGSGPSCSVNGYTFSTWNCAGHYVTGATTFNAVLTANTYTVSFNANGGEVGASSKTVTFDQSFSLPVPTREGYSFTGWQINGATVTSSYGSGLSNWNLYGSSSYTAVAQWSINSYSLTVSRNNTSAGTVSTTGGTYNYGTSRTITATTNTGYTWLGWYNGDTLLSTDLSYTFNMPASSVTYQARWGDYNLTLSRNNTSAGTVSGNSGRIVAGTSCTITASTYSGYTWLGWYNGNTLLTTNSSYTFNMPAGNLTYEARWGDYNITLNREVNNVPNPAGGIVSGSNGRIAAGTSCTITATTREGYTWLGWYDSNGTKVSTGTSLTYTFTMPASNVTYTAKWSGADEIPYQRINQDGTANPAGNYILFGEYPQTIMAAGVTIGGTADSRGYYPGSDGFYYAKVTATPASSSYTFSSGDTVISGTMYYFKVEPIKWRILEEKNGEAFILCESIIANKRYAESSNNYAQSEIRAWLNNEFYNTAFTALQQALINTTLVDNSVASTGYSPNQYACANTNDKIFLLSHVEATSSAYGLWTNASRHRTASDYSCATGTNGSAWLFRSPTSNYSNCVRGVYGNGAVNSDFSGGYVYVAYRGIVPALKIQL